MSEEEISELKYGKAYQKLSISVRGTGPFAFLHNKKLLVVESEGLLPSSQKTAITSFPERLHASLNRVCNIYFLAHFLSRMLLKTVLHAPMYNTRYPICTCYTPLYVNSMDK